MTARPYRNRIKGGMGCSRPPIERMIRLAALLRYGLPFTAGEMAARVECSRKTIVRDLIFMRDRLGWSYEFDHSSNRYRLRHAPSPQL